MQCRPDGNSCSYDGDCCAKTCQAGKCAQPATPQAVCGLVVQQGGEYYLKMNWINTAARVYLSLVSPHQQTIGDYGGYYPPMPPPIDMGYLSPGDQIVLSWKSAWWGMWGPFYSSTAADCKTTTAPGATSWTLSLDDGLHIGPATNDFSLTIYKG